MPITDFWILNEARNPFFFLFNDEHEGHDPFLLANFLGALESFTTELGEGRIDHIVFNNRLFYFLEENGFLFILMASIHHPELHNAYLKIASSLFFRFFSQPVRETIQKQMIFVEDEVLLTLLRSWLLDLLLLFENANESWQYAFQFSPADTDPVILRTVKYFTDKMIETYPKQSILYYNTLLGLLHNHPNRKDLLYIAGVAFGSRIHETHNPQIVLTTIEDVHRVLDPISILTYNSRNETFQIHLCPFCRGVKSDRPYCDFVLGVFKGVLHRDNLLVLEKECIAKGDDSCSFHVQSH